MALVLIASNDPDYYLLLSHILREAGFSVTLASSVAEVMFHAQNGKPTAIILDCPSGNNLATRACLELKRDPATFGIPAIALIGPGAEPQYLGLMQAGMDESFVRPITPSKLIGFLQRLAGLPSSSGTHSGGTVVITYANLEMDLEAHRVTRDAHPLHLGPIEFRILRHLMEHPDQVCSRDALVEAAWQHGRFVDRRTVNVHIGRLRQVLGETGGDLIKTVRSAGYILEADGPPLSR